MSALGVKPGHGVTLVGGAPVAPEDLQWAAARAPRVIAADSGADTVILAGQTPEAVIGDLDSVSDRTRTSLPQGVLHHIADQDSTDFEKCLSLIDAPLIVGLGFLGARIDHTLAALSCLARNPAPCILLGPSDVAFAAPAALRLDLAPGTRVSLFPMRPTEGRSEGLRWPIDGLRLDPSGRIGTSNEATGAVYLEAEGLLVLLPRSERDVAVRVFAP